MPLVIIGRYESQQERADFMKEVCAKNYKRRANVLPAVKTAEEDGLHSKKD